MWPKLNLYNIRIKNTCKKLKIPLNYTLFLIRTILLKQKSWFWLKILEQAKNKAMLHMGRT